jgi:hypothetical protein
MRVELNAKGELHISAETELESYALKKWCDEHISKTDSALVVHIEVKQGRPEPLE